MMIVSPLLKFESSKVAAILSEGGWLKNSILRTYTVIKKYYLTLI